MHKRASFKVARSYTSTIASQGRVKLPSKPVTVKRSSRMARFTRSSTFSMKRQKTEFKVRATLNDVLRRSLDAQSRIFFLQRVFIFGKNILPKKRKQRTKDAFKRMFEPKLDLILEHCARVAISGDIISGLLIYSGEWSMVMVESCEDLVGEFLMELTKYAPELWSDNRVFHVEDNIEKPYFDDFIIRRAPEMNVNQTFPPSTPKDYHLMAVQHFKMVDKLTNICLKLQKSLEKSLKKDPFKLREKPAKSTLSSEYHRLLPEVQRLELLMNCTAFYRRLEKYVKIYSTVPMSLDEEMYDWPLSFHFTPSNVFLRSPYEANLTFSDYVFTGQAEKQHERPSYVDPEDENAGEDDGEEGEKKDD